MNDLEIIDANILKVSESLDISKMSDDQKGRFLTNLFNTKAKYLGLDKDNVEVNVDNHMTDLSKVIKTDKIRERLDAKRKRRKSKQES